MTGKIVSHYRVLEPLGQGGMGVVYRAEDLRLGRHVALKFLTSLSPRALGRFEREARAVAALNHPNICIVYEFDYHEGQPFLAMELLEGQNLTRHIAEDTVGDVLDVSIQIAEALDAAHSKGTVHRDIKPANIFLTASGQVKVLDFGLAQIEQPEDGSGESLTVTGLTVGTVAYMSPEQAAGEETDARTDIFSFGLVMQEMAGITCPPDLLRVIRKAIERDRRFRYQSAGDLCADLKRLRRDSRSGVNVVPKSVGTTTRARKRRLLESVAVLPFVNQSGDPELEFLSEGITDTLINSLSQSRKLRVTPRSQAFRYRGPQIDLHAAGVALGVDAVLTGRVSLRGDTLIVGTELLDVGQTSQIGGGLHKRKLADIFLLQEEIASEILEALQLQLSGDEKKR
jgi:serine/threonine protein kinase